MQAQRTQSSPRATRDAVHAAGRGLARAGALVVAAGAMTTACASNTPGGRRGEAAQVDHRIKAVATVSMYDMSRVKANGWMDSMTREQRSAYLDQLAAQRWEDVDRRDQARGHSGKRSESRTFARRSSLRGW